jgi:hypothetical protein
MFLFLTPSEHLGTPDELTMVKSQDQQKHMTPVRLSMRSLPGSPWLSKKRKRLAAL